MSHETDLKETSTSRFNQLNVVVDVRRGEARVASGPQPERDFDALRRAQEVSGVTLLTHAS